MRKIPARPIPHGASAQAARSATQPGSGPGGILGLRAFLIERLAMFAVAPLIGLFAGFVLLFGGIFLSIAWTVGPKVLLDAHQYAPFTARADGHIVESWVALEFDPSVLPQGKLYWQPWSRSRPAPSSNMAATGARRCGAGFVATASISAMISASTTGKR
jgi:hypothetical protein